jgi:flagellar FliL protein
MADEEEKAEEEKEEGAEAEGSEDTEGEEGEDGETGGKFGKKKLIIMIVALLVLAGGGGAAFFLLGGSGEDAGIEDEKTIILDEDGNPIEIDPSKAFYLDLDEFLVNLNTGGKKSSFLKMSVTLELPTYADKPAVEDNIPRIRDAFQIYLRELRSSDLQGSAGIHRLREELLLRINKTIHPAKVTDILFKEIIVQ